MYRATKVLKSTIDIPSSWIKYPSECYVTLSDSFNNVNTGQPGAFEYFITDESYAGVEGKTQEYYTGSGLTGVGFLVDDDNTLLSDERKYFIYVRAAYYHFVINTLVTVFHILEKDPKATFVFCVGSGAADRGGTVIDEELRKSLEFLAEILGRHNVKYYFLKSAYTVDRTKTIQQGGPLFGVDPITVYPVYKCNNVVVVEDYSGLLGITLADVTELINKYICTIVSPSHEPPFNKKIYISRGSNSSDETFLDEKNKSLGYKDNTRMHGEADLEYYLESIGFEILKPFELDSIENQIRVLRSAKVLVGSTGTGLMNSLFMEPEGVVIELRLEMLHSRGNQELLPYYSEYAYAKSHTYIALDCSDKQATTATRKLMNLFERLDINY